MMKKETWKPVTISGLTGIMMGAASSFGVQELMAKDSSVEADATDVKATTVSDDLSFKDAFNTARAELGPGGVFAWRGNLYNTYTGDEWNAKTRQEQHDFANQVAPAVAVKDEEVQVVSQSASDTDIAANAKNTENLQTAGTEQKIPEEDKEEDDKQEASTEDYKDDVRVVGFGDVELADGRVVTVEELDYNGQRVAVVDLDKDGVPDVAIADLTGNNQPDEGEIIDLHTGDPLSFTNDAADNSDSFESFEV